MRRSLYLFREPWALAIGLACVLAETLLWLWPRHRRFRHIMLERYPGGFAPDKQAERQAWLDAR